MAGSFYGFGTMSDPDKPTLNERIQVFTVLHHWVIPLLAFIGLSLLVGGLVYAAC